MKRFIITSIVLLTSCDISSQRAVDNPQPVNQIDNKSYDGMSKAYFASGCFWCVETIYESLEGVKEVYSGYAGGSTVNPNYTRLFQEKQVMRKLLRLSTIVILFHLKLFLRFFLILMILQLQIDKVLTMELNIDRSHFTLILKKVIKSQTILIC